MDHISTLVNMGFPRARAERALSLKQNNIEAAMEWLLSPESEEPEDQDPDFLFALKMQREEESNLKRAREEEGVSCQLSGKKYPIGSIFILDDCSHRIEKIALVKYITDAIITQVNVQCPVKGCGAHISVRDMTQLAPQGKDKSLTPKVSSKQATQRIASELKAILKSEPQKNGYSVEPIKNNMYHWAVKFFDFDAKEPLGKDLKALKKDHILLHITFPPTYPLHPPFCRVINPRFQFRTGHVTIGGSICTELLTTKGWTVANTVEAVIVSIRAQFLEGGARLDLSNKRDYSESEAKEAFDRMVETHGWK